MECGKRKVLFKTRQFNKCHLGPNPIRSCTEWLYDVKDEITCCRCAPKQCKERNKTETETNMSTGIPLAEPKKWKKRPATRAQEVGNQLSKTKHTHTHTHSLSLSLSLSFCFFLSFFLSLSHTHTQSQKKKMHHIQARPDKAPNSVMLWVRFPEAWK